MSKKFFLVIFILLIFTLISSYSIYQYRNQIIQAQKVNKQYEGYYGIEVLGNELISIINKTINLNEENEIEKNDSGYYLEQKSIRVYVQFNYKNDVKLVPMEDIAKLGTEAFIKAYSTENFKCTKIEYYPNTKNVKSVTFEEI